MTTPHAHTHSSAPAAPSQPTNPMPTTPASADRTGTTAPPWTIARVSASTLAEASVFINASRRIMFPSLGHDTLLDDAGMLETSCVLVARDEDGCVVATIAYVPFDYRFPHLPPPLGLGTTSTPPSTANSSSSSLNTCILSSECSCKTVEVVRLFVLPRYRRYGLASFLFESLQDHALASGVRCLYLHTHPFLPGAIRFWEKQGLEIICVDDDEVWLTHHMRMMLGSPGLETGRRATRAHD